MRFESIAAAMAMAIVLTTVARGNRPQDASPSAPVGRLTAAFGDVSIESPAGKRAGQLHTLVGNGDRLATNGGGATVLLASRVVLKLDHDSMLTVNESTDQLNLILERGTVQVFVGERPLSSGPVSVHDPQSRAETSAAVFLVSHDPDAKTTYYACEHSTVSVESRLDKPLALGANNQLMVRNGVLGRVEQIDRAVFNEHKQSLDRLGQVTKDNGNETFRIRTRNYDTQLALNQLQASGWIDLSQIETPIPVPTEQPPRPSDTDPDPAVVTSAAGPIAPTGPIPTNAAPGERVVELSPVGMEIPTETSPTKPAIPLSHRPVRPSGTDTDGTVLHPNPTPTPTNTPPRVIRVTEFQHNPTGDDGIDPVRGSTGSDGAVPSTPPSTPPRPRINVDDVPVGLPVRPTPAAIPIRAIENDSSAPTPLPLPLPQPVLPTKIVLTEMPAEQTGGTKSVKLGTGTPRIDVDPVPTPTPAPTPLPTLVTRIDLELAAQQPLPKLPSATVPRIVEVESPSPSAPPAPPRPLPAPSPAIPLPTPKVGQTPLPTANDSTVPPPAPVKTTPQLATPLPPTDIQVRPAPSDIALPKIDLGIGDVINTPIGAPLPALPIPPATIAPPPIDLNIGAPIPSPVIPSDGVIPPPPTGSLIPQNQLPSDINQIALPSPSVGPIPTTPLTDTGVIAPAPSPLPSPTDVTVPTAVQRPVVRDATRKIQNAPTATGAGTGGG